MNWLRIGAGLFLGIVIGFWIFFAAIDARRRYFSYRELFAEWLQGIGCFMLVAGFGMLVVLALVIVVTGKV